MPTLLNFTHPDKAYWLTQPRYAVITWPLLLTPVTSMAGFGGVAIALFGIAVSGYAPPSVRIDVASLVTLS